MSETVELQPPPNDPPPPPSVTQPLLQEQPQPSQWISAPSAMPNCPPGLENLAGVNQLLVKQKVELWETFTGFETNNKFTVLNNMGLKVFHAIEETDCCVRNCCGPIRPFDMKILDNAKQEVIHLYRPLRCTSCLCFCCLQRLVVKAPPGDVIGYVTQEWSVIHPKFRIEDATGECVLRIEGPFCTFSCGGDVEFQVLSADGKTNMGKISKHWSGLAKETFTDADNFGITFPVDLDVNVKAILLGACFLIDYMFFEKQANHERDTPGMLN